MVLAVTYFCFESSFVECLRSHTSLPMVKRLKGASSDRQQYVIGNGEEAQDEAVETGPKPTEEPS
jgi:hypothetical protein